ncbi:hypothetical protein R3P38DRAFT_618494 [Favolaschia claudopus]|uniref:DRBM domain-containing protein n=1 Tax=Favolaschia claudopus TaxID=2862362 RepID=A0AAW0CBH6_9AGAR
MSNAVTRLNNYFQSRQATHSVSWSEQLSGPKHQRKWTMQVKAFGELLGTGTADTKSVAKEKAAEEALVALGIIQSE